MQGLVSGGRVAPVIPCPRLWAPAGVPRVTSKGFSALALHASLLLQRGLLQLLLSWLVLLLLVASLLLLL